MSNLKNNLLNNEINNNNEVNSNNDINDNNIKSKSIKSEIIPDKDLWTVIYSYFKDLPEDKKNKLPYKKNYYVTNHHLDSYNDFILNKIPNTLKENNPQTIFLERNENSTEYKYKYEIDLYYGGRKANKIYLGKPVINNNDERKQMFPNEARLKNLTYSSHIFCDIEIVIRDMSLTEEERKVDMEENIKTYNKIFLCEMPIMLHSKLCVLYNHTFDTLKNMGECPYEQGGYFIVDGMEKIIVGHEKKAENKIYVQSVNDEQISHTINVKSIPQGKFKYPVTPEISIKRSDNTLQLRLPGLKERIPLFIIFRALGFESDKEIMELIFGDLDDEVNQEFFNDIIPTIHAGRILYDSISCIKYMSQYTKGNSVSEVINILNSELLPHIGSSYVNKAYYLGYMTKKLLLNKNKLILNTDRDSFSNKRVDLSGFLLAELFRASFVQFQRDVKTGGGGDSSRPFGLDREYRFNRSTYVNNINNIINDANIKKIFNSSYLINNFLKAFKLGNILNKKGLIQSLQRRSFNDVLSQLRRVNTPLGADGRVLLSQRKLHSSQFGIICPVETPDGGNIGIKKHITTMTHITFGCSTTPIEKCLRQLGLRYLEEIQPEELEAGKIFLNGSMLGIHADIKRLLYILKLFRRNAIINIFTSLNWNTRFNELYISTDSGRCTRPLPVVKDNKMLLNTDIIKKLSLNLYDWDNLISGFDKNKARLDYYNCDYDCKENVDKLIVNLEKTQGVLEYIDVDEMDNCLIATSQEVLIDSNLEEIQYTHCELHSSMMFGLLGYLTPFNNCSQSIRNVFASGHCKQTVGIYCSNYKNRMDNGAHVLNYPQKPLTNTKMSKFVMNSDLPCGNNIIVAIGSFSGYNQEDSVIINKDSLDKGLFNTTYYKVYQAEEFRDKQKATTTSFYSPFEENDITPKSEYNYGKIDKFGVINENVYVNDNDVLISQFTENEEGLNDSSLTVKKGGGGLVDKVYLFNTNSDNQRLAKIRLVTTRIPETGDKFGSRYGQKGTIGTVMNAIDMPYSSSGVVPDMIVNPHAFPSRMTIGQFIETLTNKLAVNLGFIFDGTAFQKQDMNQLGRLLEEKCNFDKTGNEILYSGRTGKQMSCDMFIGPTFYQRLKQMVKDKIYSRATGPVTMRERQPPQGRAAGGGLRIGEMERDAIIAHGLSQFLKESMVERSDGSNNLLTISDHTGEFAAYNPKRNIYLSPSCDGPLKFEKNKYGELELVNKNNKSFSFSKVNIPYTLQLLLQECEAMGLQLRIGTTNKMNSMFDENDFSELRDKNLEINSIENKLDLEINSIENK